MVQSKNQTGHWSTKFLLDKAAEKLSESWQLNLKQNTATCREIHLLHVEGTVSVPPPKPNDYELFPGIGYYKFHYNKKVVFAEAQSICANEGGHLAIINSEEESNVIRTIYAKHIKQGGPWSYIGFYDRNKAQGFRDFVTIFGQPLNETGFLKWHGDDPNNVGGQQFCGCVVTDGLLGDIGCNDKISFFCEYDLSWGIL
ncbi:hypothetical protein J437_LFUL002746 [Ladona fulva]|uniref:C-type lectin domain-containing protein n=1 Tax=Ladona fulva TaxID=123851 RepID=A0A8K0K111_LADFU|nr:hypothetical protein J437_LFUL002746 [Ladona fulva]